MDKRKAKVQEADVAAMTPAHEEDHTTQAVSLMGGNVLSKKNMILAKVVHDSSAAPIPIHAHIASVNSGQHKAGIAG